MNAIHLNSIIRSASVILVQCFAGVFNYTNTTKKDSKGKTVHTNICLLGVSHLNSSLSGLVPISINQKNVSWVANIFLFHFFDWILNPQDIDGDSKNTLYIKT